MTTQNGLAESFVHSTAALLLLSLSLCGDLSSTVHAYRMQSARAFSLEDSRAATHDELLFGGSMIALLPPCAAQPPRPHSLVCCCRCSPPSQQC
jgi:hypothetical protein